MSIQQQEKELTRKNLIRVLIELPKLVEKMPEIRRDFNMELYGVYNNLKRENLNECSTIGGLLGNSARVFVDEFTNDLFIDNKFWYGYFDFKYFPYLDEDGEYPKIKWNYLFSDIWARTKFNDLDSALQRIKNLLDNDLECNEFSFETNKIIE